MIYIIDHQDSFTWNVVHQFLKFDEVYCTNYFDINLPILKKSKVIVFSPGPGSPRDYPISSQIYKEFKGEKKIRSISNNSFITRTRITKRLSVNFKDI